MIEKIAALEAAPDKAEILDYADARVIRLLLETAGTAGDETLADALWTLCETVQQGGLCVPTEELPRSEAFLAAAASGRYAAILGTGAQAKPLVLRQGRLYFHRHFHAEKTLAEGLLRLLGPGPFTLDAEATRVVFEEVAAKHFRIVFAAKQQQALAEAMRQRVFLLTGGPGTGKTTLTGALLHGLMGLRGLAPDRIRLCAPTGRAARRLREALEAAGLDTPVETLHRLLGFYPPTGRFARHAGDPLDADLVLVDEASMADVFVLAALVKAMPSGASLILVGDADQLPSVAPGSVLSALRPGADGAPIPAVSLDRGHRSGQSVLELAEAVNAGDEEKTLRLASASDDDLAGVIAAFADNLYFSHRAQGLTYAEWLDKFRDTEDDQAMGPLAEILGSARILTAARHGPRGCESINRALRRRLASRFDPEAAASSPEAGFHGAPVLITRNDDRAGLANGEIGIWLRRASGLFAYFPRPEKWLRLPAAFLPPHEPAFAVTVHKSQGSECDQALIVLPEAGHRLLSREILYTAITRARKTARISASEQALREAVRRRLQRAGGLRAYFLS